MEGRIRFEWKPLKLQVSTGLVSVFTPPLHLAVQESMTVQVVLVGDTLSLFSLSSVFFFFNFL